ncbi:uncharacterized protein I206_105937 [Kwoniella pini CBS 10737]|uniref:Uncharacterized protein n=1 Tax=Kwoniella pini CBS 10737 TaxID=1296096 RepID=A0A1B9I0K4_9TREE|nr:uncharacterized protein I206_04760 [Kwoniella pini CBS 10737]OCF49073.1 hypothetical protein I206_04760 [Kwoniella pini CBS 10737]
MSQDFTPNLRHAQILLQDLLNHIESFDLNKLMYKAPIIDRIKFESWGQDEIMGFKKWIDGIYGHFKLLEIMLNSSMPPKDDPLPTIYNLITFWKIIITSESPIVGIKLSMGGDKRLSNGFGIPSKGINGFRSKVLKKEKGPKSKQKEKEVWVDVIAQGGKEWKRIYSKKISHLLAEFREADSYINSDYDTESDSNTSSSSSSSSSSSNSRKITTKLELDNSLITTAKDLISAAEKVDRIPGAPIPKITIHLTRIPSSPKDLYINSESIDNIDWPDERIPKSFDIIRKMGVNLIFGDLSELNLPELKGPEIPLEPIPSLKFNLDITTLMGLCSDVLHYPLPKNKEEAAKRSLRPIDQLIENPKGKDFTGRGRDGTGKDNGKGKKEENFEKEFKGQSQNSIELYKCILEEMERPFITEFNKIIKDSLSYQSKQKMNESSSKVEFWTTKEAAQYTYEALSSGPAHGEGQEQRRMRIMLGLEKGDFFENSRYKNNEGFLKDFKVKIFDLEGKEEKFKPKSVNEILENVKQYAKTLNFDSDLSNSISQLDIDIDIDTDNKIKNKTGLHQTLYSITKIFLNQYYISLLPLNFNSFSNEKMITKNENKDKLIISQQTNNLPNFLQPRKLPTPPIAKISLPFPVVSLHSLNQGSKENMTTIMMGTATLKEVWGQSLWRIRGWEKGWYNWNSSLNDENNNNNNNNDCQEIRENGFATVIIFPYRVFGEGKRVRFLKGDYSYPTKEWWDDVQVD